MCIEEKQNRQYFLSRISHESNVSYALLDQGKIGYLTLGWSLFSDTDILDAARENGYPRFDIITTEKGNNTTKSRWCMWYFAQMNVGDIVIVPKYDGLFGAYEVIESAKPIASIESEISVLYGAWDNSKIIWKDQKLYNTKEERLIDLGFVVKVRPLFKEFKRRYITSELNSRMKIRTTTANISDIKTIQECINAGIENKPITLYENVIEELADSLWKKLALIPDDMQFEKVICWYFRKCGAQSWVLPKNDPKKTDYADADVIASFDNLKLTIFVQAKHHNIDSITSDWSVTQIVKYKEQGVGQGEEKLNLDKEDEESMLDNQTVYSYWVISSAKEYGVEAKANAEKNHIRLISGKEFAQMLVDIGIKDIDEALGIEE